MALQPKVIMNKKLVISAISSDRAGIVHDLSQIILDSGCNIEDSRMIVLSGEFSILLLVSGPWNTIAKLEGLLPTLEDKLNMHITVKTTEDQQERGRSLAYGVDVIALDHPGIVHNLASFFSSRKINIQELSTTTYAAAHTGTPMFAVHITVNIPAELRIASLREEFMDFCDQLNLDAVIEPIKE